jgi:hypothetical protein
MAIELDLEAVSEASGRTRYERWLAVLIGAAALLAVLLATIHVDAGKGQERALLMSARLGVRVFEGTAGSSPRFGFQIHSMQLATSLALNATAVQIAVLGSPETADALQAAAEADVKAGNRLLVIAQTMGDPPTSASGVDPATLKLAGSTPDELFAVVAEQNHQADIADRYGERGNRALYGLSLLALGAVLIGLAAVIGTGAAGRVIITAAAVSVLAAAALGVAALMA